MSVGGARVSTEQERSQRELTRSGRSPALLDGVRGGPSPVARRRAPLKMLKQGRPQRELLVSARSPALLDGVQERQMSVGEARVSTEQGRPQRELTRSGRSPALLDGIRGGPSPVARRRAPLKMLKQGRPQRELNPCYRRERPMS